MRRSALLGLLPVLALAGCTARGTPTPPPSTPEPAASQPPATAAALTLEQLKNMSYELQSVDSPRSVTLTDGAFTSPDPAAGDYADIHLLDTHVLADLDGDGDVDAAVLLAENYGGTGTFVSLIEVKNESGTPVQDASVFIDDRAQVNSLAYEDGELVLDGVIHGPDDPMCCPTRHVILTFRLVDGALTADSITTFAPDGRERSITIDSPAAGAEVSGSVQVTGSFTISPFENNLAYRIYDLSGAELGAGPITVLAEELGGPGTFDETINLGAVPAGTPVRVAIQDVSAADGSIMAMDSVYLGVR